MVVYKVRNYLLKNFKIILFLIIFASGFIFITSGSAVSNNSASVDMHLKFIDLNDEQINANDTLKIPLKIAGNTNEHLYFWTNSSVGQIDNNTFVWKPQYNDVGIHHITFFVSNARLYGSKTINITVIKNKGIDFSSNTSSGLVPLTVKFTSISENSSSLEWDFGDGFSSNEKHPVHVYNEPGNYTVFLKEKTDNGDYVKQLLDFITVYPVSNQNILSLNINGNKIVSVNDTLTLQLSTSDKNQNSLIYWTDSTVGTLKSNIFVWKPKLEDIGNHNISFFVSDGEHEESKIVNVKVIKNLSISSNISSGRAPLAVHFNVSSLNATDFEWNFGDGAFSHERNPIHVYTKDGNYNIFLKTKIDNQEIVTQLKDVISVTYPEVISSSSGTSSNSGSKKSTSSTSAIQTRYVISTENKNNLESSEMKSLTLPARKLIIYNFTQNDNPVSYIKIRSLRDRGTVRLTTDILKNKSISVSTNAPDIVYKNFNVGISQKDNTSSNDEFDKDIDYQSIGFKVQKSWAQNNNINISSMNLYNYNNSKWNLLDTHLTNEDMNYLYYESIVPGFSPFAITAKMNNHQILNSSENIYSSNNSSVPVKKDELSNFFMSDYEDIFFKLFLALSGLSILGLGYLLLTRGKKRSGDAAPKNRGNVIYTANQTADVVADIKTLYEFDDNHNPITAISFISKNDLGIIPIKIEILKNTSLLVAKAPIGEVYKNVNIWFGDTNLLDTAIMADMRIEFKVYKNILQQDDNSSFVKLLKYYADKWYIFDTNKISVDDMFEYFESYVPDFGIFAITVLKTDD